jgi:hypothetical protein
MGEDKQDFHGVNDPVMGKLTLQVGNAGVIRYMWLMHKIVPDHG